MRAFRKGLLALAATGLLALLACLLRAPYDRMAAEHWRRQLEQAPAGQAELLADRLARLGPAGIRELASALGSKHEAVAAAARRALWAELERWEAMPSRAAAYNLAVLAEALSANAKRFGPAARRDATDLAAEILRWLPDSGLVDRVDVIAHCDQVLEYASLDQPAVKSLTAAIAASLAREAAADGDVHVGGADDMASPARSPDRPLLDMLDMSAGILAIPGGGLPIETFPDVGLIAGKGTTSPKGRSDLRPPEGTANGPARLGSPRKLYVPDRVRPLSVSEPVSGRLESTVRILGAEPTAPLSPPQDPKFGKIETEVLMRWLLTDDADVVLRAEVELRRRGFTDVQLELARRLFDPDPAVRIQLARTVPRLTSIDPVPWLLWLSRDPRTEVRLAAISLMATTGDPALLSRIRQMAREDADAAVQQVARRLEGR